MIRRFRVIECGSEWHGQVVWIGKEYTLEELIDGQCPIIPKNYNGDLYDINLRESKKEQGDSYIIFEEFTTKNDYHEIFHANVKSILDEDDVNGIDDSLVWVGRIPLRIEDGEVIWSVEFVHFERFEEYKTSELVNWYQA